MAEDFSHGNVGMVATVIGAVVLVLGMLGLFYNLIVT